MPTYVLPKAEKEEAPEINTGDWERRVRVPVNKEIMEMLQVGADISVTLQGEVVGLQSSDNEEESRRHLEFRVTEVSVYGEDEVKETFKKGFTKAYKRRG